MLKHLELLIRTVFVVFDDKIAVSIQVVYILIKTECELYLIADFFQIHIIGIALVRITAQTEISQIPAVMGILVIYCFRAGIVVLFCFYSICGVFSSGIEIEFFPCRGGICIFIAGVELVDLGALFVIII